jgi:hypothetical protein
MLWVLVALLGCGEEAPLFNGIYSVTVQKVGSRGLQKRVLGEQELPSVAECLAGGTTEIAAEAVLTDLLPSTYLIEISDASGARSFELYTQQNLKGNHGKYYANGCLLPQIQALGL